MLFKNSADKIEIPSLPANLSKIIELTRDINTNAATLAKVIMLDQSLSAKVLRLSNSAYFIRRQKAETVTDSVKILGFGLIRNLAASSSILEAFFPKKVFMGFDWGQLWHHSVATAVASEAIYCYSTGSVKHSEETIFVAGLMHDIGKMVIASVLPIKFMQIVEIVRDRKIDLVKAENIILSTNHALIGKELAAAWELPEKMQIAIGYHHNPESAPEFEDLARSVSAANLLVKRMDRSYIIGHKNDISTNEICEVAGIDKKGLDQVIQAVYKGMESCGEIMAWANEFPMEQDRAA